MKKITRILFTSGIFWSVFLLLIGTSLWSKPRFVTIGTGGLTGVYYPTGGAIARIVNQKKDQYNLKATVESTGGSVFNVNAILSGDLEFGIVQSDRQYQAYNGLAEWDGKPQKNLRAVFSIHYEAVTLVAANDAGIRSLKDLKGKTVNIGNVGSGQRQNSIDALMNAGLNYESDLKAESVKAADAAGLLQDGRIDAYFYTVGHPNGSVTQATTGTRKVRIVPIVGTEQLVKKFPYYAKTSIPMSLYPSASNKGQVETFGVKATLVTRRQIPVKVVYAITKEVFENFEDFKKLHPAYQGLTKADLMTGLSAPVHRGAQKYFKEAGLK